MVGKCPPAEAIAPGWLFDGGDTARVAKPPELAELESAIAWDHWFESLNLTRPELPRGQQGK